jgi:hypothetical protein
MLTIVSSRRQDEIYVSRKSKNFYYLLPGQGRGARKRWVRNHIAALLVGCMTAALLFWLLYKLES